MPAKSKAQQKFMGMVHAAQKGEKAASAKVAKVAKRMKKKDAEDYASTKHKGLPKKVKKEDLIRLISKYGAKRVKETIMAVRPKSVTVSGSGLNRKPEEPDFEYDPEDVDEGFGGELRGKNRDKFEKARKENAEQLGYKVTGKSDTKKQTLKMANELNESVNEYDLGLTYKKGKTVKVTHKKSGKELVIIDKPNVKREYEKIGYFAESVKEERDYKAEYKKFQSSTKAKKYRAELNQYNRKKGTYGNGDGKDASHKGGKIAGFEKESTNRGRREKSRLKTEGHTISFTKEEMAQLHNDGQIEKDGHTYVYKESVGEVSNPTSGIMMARIGTGHKFSSPEAKTHVNKDVTTMSKFLGKASQQVIKTMMNGVKGGKYNAMDLARGIQTGPANRTHYGETDFIQQLWNKVREKFRRYSPSKKLS